MSTSVAGPTQPPLAAPTRRALVDAARERWIRRLLDLSRRNNLLYFRELARGTLDLSDASPAALSDLTSGSAVPLTRLLPATDLVPLLERAVSIRRRALANLEEKGIATLFLAFGMASWTPGDDGRAPAAAVLLLPVTIEARGRDQRSLVLR